jgi:hypothetical protein
MKTVKTRKRSDSHHNLDYSGDMRIMHAQDARFVFVRVFRGLWVRLDACVAVTACPACAAPIGEPCRGKRGLPMGATHYKRRYKASGRLP